MKSFKKLLCLAASLFVLAGCNSSNNPSDDASVESSETTTGTDQDLIDVACAISTALFDEEKNIM